MNLICHWMFNLLCSPNSTTIKANFARVIDLNKNINNFPMFDSYHIISLIISKALQLNILLLTNLIRWLHESYPLKHNECLVWTRLHMFYQYTMALHLCTHMHLVIYMHIHCNLWYCIILCIMMCTTWPTPEAMTIGGYQHGTNGCTPSRIPSELLLRLHTWVLQQDLSLGSSQ